MIRSSRRGVSCSALAAVTVLIACVAAAEKQAATDWPVFRGNALQNGIAASPLPEALAVRWKFNAKDSIESAAAIVGDTVYVASMDEHLYALERATGKEKWRYKAAPFKAAPSVQDGMVFVGDMDGVFHCVEAATGKNLWKFATGGEIVSGANFAGDHVLFGSYADETLYCLSKDGKKVWKFKIGGPVNGSPAVSEGRTFVAGCDSILHVLDAAQGKEIATVELDGQAGASAAVDGTYLYVGTMTNQLLAIDWKKPVVLWKFEAAKRQQPFYASAAVTPRLVIAGSRDKFLYAVDRKTGKEAWKFQTRGKVDGSPVVVGSRVFVGSFDGNLYVLDLEKGTELSHFDLGKSIAASPAVAENCLVIGTTDGTVYCLGAKE